MDLKETDVLGNAISNHWYYRSKAKAIVQLLSQSNITTILDVGAGSGFFSRYLLAHSEAKESWCIDINYNGDIDTDEAGKPVYFRRNIGFLNADLVLLMDVLEHVNDDVGLLSEYVQKVPRGAQFIISVPAFQFIWSSHDVFLDHKRRYRLTQLEEVVEKAGLKIKRGAYYFGAVFPIAATIRVVNKIFKAREEQYHSQLKLHHPCTNRFLTLLSSAELYVMKNNRIAGLTAFCLAEK